VASSLEVVIAQRLVRVICPRCKAPMAESDLSRLREEFGELVPKVIYKGKGCQHCHGLGYRGRTGIFELMPVTDEIRSLILGRVPSPDVRKMASKQGMMSLRRDGWRLVAEGVTTPEEVIGATKDEHVADAVAQGNGGGK
jgi:type II secretory ATPase GspE/PulE/Tfp pilus assembly ATPase PilB-like protein